MKHFFVMVEKFNRQNFPDGLPYQTFWFRSKRDALFGACLLASCYDVVRIGLEGSDDIKVPDFQLCLDVFDAFFSATYEHGFKEYVRK